MENELEEKPIIKTEQIKEVEEDLRKYLALGALKHSEGGQVFISALRAAVADDVQTIISLIKAPEIDLRCAVARLKSDFDLLLILKNVDDNGTMAKAELESLMAIEKERQA